MKRVDGRARISSKGEKGVKNPLSILSCYKDRNQVGKSLNPNWREKLLSSAKVPVPQTDTGRRGENPKTNGRTLVKELGKMTP